MGHFMKRLNPLRSNASTHPNSQGEAESRCPACSNDHFNEVLPQVLMTLIKSAVANWGTGLFGFEWIT